MTEYEPSPAGAAREIAFYLDDSVAAPARVEFLWGEPLDDGSFRIVSPPYYVPGIACGDVVEVGEDPELHFIRALRPSGHSTLRMFIEPGAQAQEIINRVETTGAQVSPTERQQYYVVDVPDTADITDVLDILSTCQDDDECDWIPGSISSVHGRALRAVMGEADLPDWVPRD